MIEMPLCAYHAIAYRDNDDKPLERAFRAADLANRHPELEAAANQTWLGGDSSMDIPPSSPIPPLDEDGGEVDSLLPGETIARLHIRRSRQDLRFAELEGVVPLGSAVQISMDFNRPFHTRTQTRMQRRPPGPTRRSLPWLRSWNQAGGEKGETGQQERPASVLDAHFLPCCISRRVWSHADGIFAGEPNSTEADIVLGMNVHVHRLTDLVDRGFPVRQIAAQDRGGPGFDAEPVGTESPGRAVFEEFRLPPPPVERVLATTDQEPRQLAPGRNEANSDEIDADTVNAGTDARAGRDKDEGPEKKAEGKGKSVAWDSTVAGGEETSSDIDSDAESESSHESYERELADYYPASILQGGEPRKRGSVTSPLTPARSREYLELYPVGDREDPRDESDETRLASLAMPGRWQRRRIGRGAGVICSRCGHRE